MVGSAVAITVESRFCMNSALATITAVRRVSRETRLGCAGDGSSMLAVSLRQRAGGSPTVRDPLFPGLHGANGCRFDLPSPDLHGSFSLKNILLHVKSRNIDCRSSAFGRLILKLFILSQIQSIKLSTPADAPYVPP